MKRFWLKAEWLAVAAAVPILVVVLFLKPVIGLADNGDFQRIMMGTGLEYLDDELSYEDKYFGYFIRQFRMTEPGFGGYVSTQWIPVFLAKGLSGLVHPGIFDMRALAAIYGGLLLAALWLLIRVNKGERPWANVLLALLGIVLFVDVGYLAYFNSLYGEPLSFVFLLLSFGFATALVRRERPSVALLAGFFLAALFLAGAKVQNAPVGVLLALLGLRFLVLRKDKGWRRLVVIFSSVLLLVSVALYVALPKEIRIINQYQTVFYGVLKDSPTPEQDLRELGIPEKFAVNAGTNYFEEAPIDQQDPVFAEEYYPNFSHLKVALFYLKHPGRLVDKLEVSANQGMTIRPYYLGNYEQSSGKPAGSVAERFGWWSAWKREAVPNKLWFVALAFVAYFAVVWLEWRLAKDVRKKLYAEVFGFLGIVALIQFVLPVIGDGEADLAKHLFGFNVAFDLMLWAGAGWLLNRVLFVTDYKEI